jgi:hypothetical protein
MTDLVGYDEIKQLLEVRFVNSGQMYAYRGVPKKEYKKLLNASTNGDLALSIISC